MKENDNRSFKKVKWGLKAGFMKNNETFFTKCIQGKTIIRKMNVSTEN